MARKPSSHTQVERGRHRTPVDGRIAEIQQMIKTLGVLRRGGLHLAKCFKRGQRTFGQTHSAYIGWEEHERNLKHLRESAQAIGSDRRKSPPREGPALLQGLVVCGRCGRRMTLRQHARADRFMPQIRVPAKGNRECQTAMPAYPGFHLDPVVGDILYNRT